MKWFTIHGYLDILQQAGFIKVIYEPIPVELTNVFKVTFTEKAVELERKIPESLTIKKAMAMARKPWLQWFMEE